MKKGKISNLFDYLYLTIATTLSVLFYINGLSRHFSAYEEKTFFMKVCLKEKYTNDYETWRIVAQVFYLQFWLELLFGFCTDVVRISNSPVCKYAVTINPV